MSESTFGEKVVGKEAAAKAIAAAKGGGEVFGKRVVDAIAEPSADYLAKKNSEFGARVIGNAKAQDHKGSSADGGSPSIKELENILEENPTTFDSLYEAELARSSGPRVEALRIFAVVENGIKGAGRPSVLNEINGLLGKNKVTAAQRADRFRALSTQVEEQQERMDENAKLLDADRVKALRKREENLAFLDKSSRKSTKSQVATDTSSPDTETQVRAIAKRDKLDTADAPKSEPEPDESVDTTGESGRGPHANLAEDDVKPETSSRAPRQSQKKRKTKRSRRKSAKKSSEK